MSEREREREREMRKRERAVDLNNDLQMHLGLYFNHQMEPCIRVTAF